MSLHSHLWLFLTPRTEAQAEAEIRKGCGGPPSLLREGKPPHTVRCPPSHPPTMLHRWPSEGQGKLPRDRGKFLTSHVNPSTAPPFLGTTTDPLPVPIPPHPVSCSVMHPVHIHMPGLVLVLRTQHRARQMGVLVH